MMSNAPSKAAIIITDALDVQSCSEGIVRAPVQEHTNIYDEYDWVLKYFQARYSATMADTNG